MSDEIMNVNAETGEIIPENNLEIVDNNYFNGKDIVSELTTGVKYFTTFQDELVKGDPIYTEMLMKALLNADVSLEECVGQTVYIKEIVSYYTPRKNGDILPIFILFDENNKSYVTGSVGVYNSLKKIIPLMAKLGIRENPYGVKITKEMGGNGHKFTKMIPVGFKKK